MAPPTIWLRVRQTLGRALRETGQALDRVGIRGQQHAVTTRVVGDDPYVFDDHLSRHRHQMPLLNRGRPLVSPEVAYLAPCSTLIGSVRIGPGASVWYGAILRADACENGSSFAASEHEDEELPWSLPKSRIRQAQFDTGKWIGGGIFVGENSNVQDGCIITSKEQHTVIGKGVTIGHLAQIHSATVEDHCLIGMGSLVLEGAVVETESLVAAGAVVAPGTTVPSGELWVGQPARKLRDLTSEERAKLHYQANEYVKVAQGQRGVMELGGNMPDSLIEHLMIGGGGSTSATSPGMMDDGETTGISPPVPNQLIEEKVSEKEQTKEYFEEEEEEKLKVGSG